MYLGIDLGTSSLKLVLLDDQHHIHASVDAPISLQRSHPNWSEQNPTDWWKALESSVAQLRAVAPVAWSQVRAIGLSGQMHGAVVLDAQMEVLRPAILWNDGRSGAQCLALEQRVPQSRLITGNLAMPGFTAPKLLWIAEHERSVFKAIKKVLLPKDWLRLQLTGDCVSDMSDASGTLWLDVGNRCWSEPMLAACGLNLSHMPSLIEGSQPSGTIRPALTQAWGLPAGVMVAGGGGDNAASAVGIGAARPGQGFVSLGTSGVVFMVSDTYQPAPELAIHAFAHALPGRWHLMSVMLSAASAFGWIAQLTGSASEAQLAARVAELSPDRRAAAPVFLPYLSGERTPHNNPDATGAFIGLHSEHTAADLGYSVMEGVTFGLMDGLRSMGQSQPSNTPLALVGGGARSDAWAQLLASGLGCPLQRSENAQAAAALGAARLAWLADGGSEKEVCQPLPMAQTFVSDDEVRQSLAQRYQRYRGLYPALTNFF